MKTQVQVTRWLSQDYHPESVLEMLAHFVIRCCPCCAAGDSPWFLKRAVWMEEIPVSGAGDEPQGELQDGTGMVATL